MVREAVLFLEGRIPELVKTLRERMKTEAEALRFEEAARLRDAAEAVEKTLTRQNVVSLDLEDRDVFGLYREGPDLAVAVLFVREGSVVGATGAAHSGFPEDAEAIRTSIMQFYGPGNAPPPSVLVPVPMPDEHLLSEVLSELRGSAVRIHAPRRGSRRALIAMAGKNAAYVLAHSDRALRKRALALEDLKTQLKLPGTPHRIECFDASHISGAWAVGALAVFRDGAPESESTRTYRIRNARPGDDFDMIAELVQRRFAPDKEPSPDLLIVDGGPGQLSSALGILRRSGRDPFPVVGMAKDRGQEGKPDRIHLPGGGIPLLLPERSPALYLLQRIRDEAHRIAVGYHRKMRRARTLRAGIEEIPGIGPKRRSLLLKHFGSLKALRGASLEAVADVPGIPRAVAEALVAFFREDETPQNGNAGGGGEG
jgi:excinuclease ABC subunit C